MRALETALLLAGGLPAALAIGPLRPRVAAFGGARRAGRVTAVVAAVGFVARVRPGGPCRRSPAHAPTSSSGSAAAAARGHGRGHGEFLEAVRAGRVPRLGAFGRVTARP